MIDAVDLDLKELTNETSISKLCDVCKEGNDEEEAVGFCTNCDQYLCAMCKQYHQRVATTRTHTILGVNDLPTKSMREENASSEELELPTCYKHRGLVLEFYCEEHIKPICKTCKIVDHRKCKAIELITKIANDRSIGCTDLIDNINFIDKSFDKIKKEKDREKADLLAEKIKITGAIKEKRKEFDRLEEKALHTVEEIYEKESSVIDRHIEIIEHSQPLVSATLKQLEKAFQTGTAEEKFIVAKSASNDVNQFAEILHDTKSVSVRTIHFTENDELSLIETLGELTLAKHDFEVEIDFHDDRKHKPPLRAPLPLPQRPPKTVSRNDLDNRPKDEEGDIPAQFVVRKDQLHLQETLFFGEMGPVFKGMLSLQDGKKIRVAGKTFSGNCRLSPESDIIMEAKIMMHLDHKHIIQMIGLCKPDMLIFELAPLGQLNYFLEKHKKTSQANVVQLLWQVAMGMEYLESKNYVHRNLAARNVLLVSEHFAKISAFEMAKVLANKTDCYEATEAGKWPLKWYAPECIYYWQFDSTSDVWSYGVVIWEATSYGDKPYKGKKGAEILHYLVEEGKRLEKPEHCDEDVYEVMLSCWECEKTLRPTFSELTKDMSRLYRRMSKQS